MQIVFKNANKPTQDSMQSQPQIIRIYILILHIKFHVTFLITLLTLNILSLAAITKIIINLVHLIT